MNRLKEHKLPLFVSAGFLLLAAACIVLYNIVAGTLSYVDSAKVWAGENELFYSYVSCFMPVNEKIDESDVFTFGKTVDSKLTEASLTAKEGAQLWNYAYCGTGMVSTSTLRGNAKVNAVGIGGDFFFFHPYYLHSGGYISGSDLMKDKVVLDKELAWTLFGATDVAGMELLIEGQRFIVAGVIEPEDDFASKKAKTLNGGLYMSYEKLAGMTKTGIDCYEAVIPDPVKNFAMNITKENFPSENCEIIDVGRRYEAGAIADVASSFGSRSMRTDGIVFPEWENAARLTEDYCAALLVLGITFAIAPVVYAAVLFREYGKIYGKKLADAVKEKSAAIMTDITTSFMKESGNLKTGSEKIVQP